MSTTLYVVIQILHKFEKSEFTRKVELMGGMVAILMLQKLHCSFSFGY